MGDRGKKRQHPAQGAVSVGGWPAARCPRLLMTATPVGPPSPSPPPGATDVCSGAREQLGWHEFKTHDRALRAGRARDTLRGSAPPDDPPPRPPSLPACRARGQARGLGGRGRTCRRGWRGRRGRTRRPPARDGGGLGWRWWRRFRATQRPPGRRWGPAADARAFPRLGASPRRPPPPYPSNVCYTLRCRRRCVADCPTALHRPRHRWRHLYRRWLGASGSGSWCWAGGKCWRLAVVPVAAPAVLYSIYLQTVMLKLEYFPPRGLNHILIHITYIHT